MAKAILKPENLSEFQIVNNNKMAGITFQNPDRMVQISDNGLKTYHSRL
jgi:hypothetical protein